MLSVGFVVTPGFPVMSLAALSVFEFANFSAEKPLYDIHVLSEDGGPIPSASGTSLETKAFGDRRFDTLIIGGNTRVVPTSPKLLAFVSAAAKISRRISSICTGVLALADAVLLGNRRVTTHWLFTDELKTRFPGVRLEADRIYIVDGPIWTAAGNSAGSISRFTCWRPTMDESWRARRRAFLWSITSAREDSRSIRRCWT